VPKLLAIIPHPDDEAYSFGGTIALATLAGWECLVVCCSSGEAGELNGGPPNPATLGPLRERELVRSCEALGAAAPRFWRWPDGALSGLDGAGDVRRLLEQEAPDLVIALGADGAYGHPDHLAVHRWVVDAWSVLDAARPPLLFAAFPRGLFLPQYAKCIGMMGDPPDPPASAIGAAIAHYEVPVATVAATKLAAISAHASQLPGGRPEALFPPGIVASLLEVESFTDARGIAYPATSALLSSLAGTTGG